MISNISDKQLSNNEDDGELEDLTFTKHDQKHFREEARKIESELGYGVTSYSPYNL